MDRSEWLKERRRVGEEVRTWVEQARFPLVAETVGDDYHRFLVQKGG